MVCIQFYFSYLSTAVLWCADRKVVEAESYHAGGIIIVILVIIVLVATAFLIVITVFAM